MDFSTIITSDSPETKKESVFSISSPGAKVNNVKEDKLEPRQFEQSKKIRHNAVTSPFIMGAAKFCIDRCLRKFLSVVLHALETGYEFNIFHFQ